MLKGSSLLLSCLLLAALFNASPVWAEDDAAGLRDDPARVAELLAGLDSPFTGIRRDSLVELAGLAWDFDDPGCGRVLQLLADPDVEIRSTVAGFALARGREDVGRPVVLALLADPVPCKREAGALLCADYLADDPELLPLLLELCNDDDKFVRAAALAALVPRDDVPAELVPGLIETLRSDGYNHARANAAAVLARFSATDAGVREALIGSLDQPESALVREVSNALIPLGEQAAPAIPKLARCLECPCFHFNYEYLYEVLVRLAEGPGNRELITEAVAGYLDNEDDAIVYRACLVLNHNETTDPRIRDKGFVMLRDPDSDRRILGGLLLTKLFMDDPATVAPLVDLLGDEDKYVRHQACLALLERGELAAPVAGELAALVREDYYLPARGAAILALGASGTADPAIHGLLAELATGDEPELAAMAGEALEQLGGNQ